MDRKRAINAKIKLPTFILFLEVIITHGMHLFIKNDGSI